MQTKNLNKLIVALVVFVCLFSVLKSTCAQAVSQRDAEALSVKQLALSEKYKQLEAVLLRMAELNAPTNPRRAALLKKVLGESKDRLIALRMNEVSDVLDKSRYTQAIETQEKIENDLDELLKLLESENRDKIRNNEKEKIKEFLKAIDDMILEQKSLRARTNEAEKYEPLSKDQDNLRDKAEKLSDRMDDSKKSDSKSKNENSKNGSNKISDKQSEQKSDNESENLNDNKSDSDQKSGENNQNDKPKDGKPQDGEKSDSEKDDKSDAKLSPTQKAMQQAQRRMRQAKEQLDRAEKRGALQDQEEAIAELQRARAELEKILRQLREEELMQTLQFLDARLQKMLQLEKAVKSQTERLDKQQTEANEKPESEADTFRRQLPILAGRLGADQMVIVGEADGALVLLMEDGTARAMYESLEQCRFDMVEVSERLNRTDISGDTQTVENTIIESLQEMIEAVQLAKKESQERKNNENDGDQSPQDGSEQDQRLISILSELRMVRTMQKRVNERTTRYENMLNEGKSDLAVLQKGVEELTRQQNRIQSILRDISLGKYQ